MPAWSRAPGPQIRSQRELRLLGFVQSRPLAGAVGSLIHRLRPSAVAIASAYVSVDGLEEFRQLLPSSADRSCRLVAGTNGHITQPRALDMVRHRWKVRLGRSTPPGIFHPKLVVLGSGFRPDGSIRSPNGFYIGSGNLTYRGLFSNVECGVIGTQDDLSHDASNLFGELWSDASRLTDPLFRRYSQEFLRAAHRRSIEDFRFLVRDENRPPRGQSFPRFPRRGRGNAAAGPEFADLVWVEIKNPTGGGLQVEFPRTIGNAVERMISRRHSSGWPIFSLADGTRHALDFHFYESNKMYRLNVPSSIHNMNWIARHRRGWAVVSRGEGRGAPPRLHLLREGDEARELLGRTQTLGTWESTSTRRYGWL